MMKLFNNKKEVETVYDISIKIKMCPQHLDFCKMSTDKVQSQAVVGMLRLIQACPRCKVVIE